MDEYNVTDNITLGEDIGESIVDSISEDVSTDNGTNITVVINNPVSEKQDSELSDQLEVKEKIKTEPEEWVLVDVTQTKTTITPQSTNGIKSVVLSVIGNYETTTTDYTYQTYQGSTQHNIYHEPDYSWLCSCAIFLVCLYCMFRLYGLVFRKGR